MSEEHNKDQPRAAENSAKNEQSDEQKAEAALQQAMHEMENDHVVDETAATVVHPADIGTSVHALQRGPTTSPGILARVAAERAKNLDPDRENKVFARDVLGLDVEVAEPEDEGHDGIYGADSSSREGR